MTKITLGPFPSSLRQTECHRFLNLFSPLEKSFTNIKTSRDQNFWIESVIIDLVGSSKCPVNSYIGGLWGKILLGPHHSMQYHEWPLGKNGNGSEWRQQAPRKSGKCWSQFDIVAKLWYYNFRLHHVTPLGPKILFPIDLHVERDICKSVDTFFRSDNIWKV